ncbi:hypothetical protein PV328_011791, partial [Microctonus aethiopoides]
MEGSRLQKLEKLRDLTQPYVEIAAELGIVEDPTARSLVMEVLKDKVREKNLQVVPAGPERRMKIQFRIREETQHPLIVAGVPCERCGYSLLQVKKSEEQPLRVAEVPRPRLRPPLRSDATPKTISVAHIQRTPQRPMFKPLPYLWREESEVVTRELINILERNPNYPREPSLKKSRASVYEDQLSIATVVWLTSGPHPGKYEAVIPRSQGIFGIDKVLRIVNDYFAFSDWRFQENLNWFRKTCDAAADVCPLLGCRAKIFCGTIGSRKEPGAQHIYLSCRLFEIFQERTK